jgi:secretion/DNA translocation related TadE-like protein
MSRLHATERGSATIWLLGFSALVLAISCVAVLQTLAVLARHRADAVADLAALAGAQRIGLGTDPCAAARRVAGENSATLTACSTSLDPAGRTGTIAIRLHSEVSLPLVGHRWVTARARAGRLAGQPVATPPAPTGRSPPASA